MSVQKAHELLTVGIFHSSHDKINNCFVTFAVVNLLWATTH